MGRPKSPNKRVRIEIYVPPDLAERIRERATAEGVSPSAVVQQLLDGRRLAEQGDSRESAAASFPPPESEG